MPTNRQLLPSRRTDIEYRKSDSRWKVKREEANGCRELALSSRSKGRLSAFSRQLGYSAARRFEIIEAKFYICISIHAIPDCDLREIPPRRISPVKRILKSDSIAAAGRIDESRVRYAGVVCKMSLYIHQAMTCTRYNIEWDDRYAIGSERWIPKSASSCKIIVKSSKEGPSPCDILDSTRDTDRKWKLEEEEEEIEYRRSLWGALFAIIFAFIRRGIPTAVTINDEAFAWPQYGRPQRRRKGKSVLYAYV